jgi:hypothetical protein
LSKLILIDTFLNLFLDCDHAWMMKLPRKRWGFVVSPRAADGDFWYVIQQGLYLVQVREEFSMLRMLYK